MSTTVVKLLKDVGAEFGCKGDIYRNTEAQIKALDARVSQFKLGKAYEVVKTDAGKVAQDVETDVKSATSTPAAKETK